MLLLKKYKAVELRKRGYSLSEISKRLQVAKSTTSLWSRNITISRFGIKRIFARRMQGRVRSIKMRRKKRRAQEAESMIRSARILRSLRRSRVEMQIFCSLLYWCEGSREKYSVRFTNSNPILIRAFLHFLRSGFTIDEKKMRACIHLHSYHSEKQQKDFWSKMTDIPQKQFLRSFRKINTGKRKKEGYPGCLSVRYNDSQLARDIHSFIKSIGNSYGRVG